MKLQEYLSYRKISQAEFALRAGIPQSTVGGICLGSGCTAETALRIINASNHEVTLADLTGKEKAERRRA